MTRHGTTPHFTDLGEGLHQISTPFGPGSVVVFLLRAERTVLIDAGVFGTPSRILRPALAELGLRLDDVDTVIGTHAHVDHRGGMAELQLAGAEIAAAPFEAPLFESNAPLVNATAHIYERLGFPAAADARRAMLADLLGGPAAVSQTLRGGDIVTVGDGISLEVVETPGHTEGSISLYWRERQGLFTGDAVGGQTDEGRLPVTEAPQLLESGLDRIRALDPAFLWMAHDSRLAGVTSGNVAAGRESARALVDATATVHRVIEAAVRSIHEAEPGLPDAEFVRRAGAVLRERWDLMADPRTGLPGPVPATLLSYVDAVRSTPAPGTAAGDAGGVPEHDRDS